jgi:hypothetical protein
MWIEWGEFAVACPAKSFAGGVWLFSGCSERVFWRNGYFLEPSLLLIQKTRVIDLSVFGGRLETISLYGFKKTLKKNGYFFGRCL